MGLEGSPLGRDWRGEARWGGLGMAAEGQDPHSRQLPLHTVQLPALALPHGENQAGQKPQDPWSGSPEGHG